jgi:hypothetical protein
MGGLVFLVSAYMPDRKGLIKIISTRYFVVIKEINKYLVDMILINKKNLNIILLQKCDISLMDNHGVVSLGVIICSIIIAHLVLKCAIIISL